MMYGFHYFVLSLITNIIVAMTNPTLFIFALNLILNFFIIYVLENTYDEVYL